MENIIVGSGKPLLVNKPYSHTKSGGQSIVHSHDIMEIIINYYSSIYDLSNLMLVSKLWHTISDSYIKSLIHIFSKYLAHTNVQPNIFVPFKNKNINDYKFNEYTNKYPFNNCTWYELLNWFEIKINILAKNANIYNFIIPYSGNYYKTENCPDSVLESYNIENYLVKKVVRKRTYNQNKTFKFKYIEKAKIKIPL
jgi:hypothetical protein